MDERKTLDDWVAYLSERELPLLKHSCQALKELGPYESVSMAKFSNVALTDPGLTLTILRAASAIPRSRLQDEIHTIDAAALTLGVGKMTQVIEAMKFLEECVKNDADKALYMRIVARCYHAAYQAYGMARERVDITPEELFTAAMLHDIGALMLLLHGDGILGQCTTLDDAANQREVLGFTLRELSSELAKTWKLSSFFIKSMEEYDGESQINPRLYEIHLASDLALNAEQGWETEEMEAIIEKVAAHLHCDVEEAMLEVRDNAIHCAEETTFYGVVPAAASLPDLEDDIRNNFMADIEFRAAEKQPKPSGMVEVASTPDKPEPSGTVEVATAPDKPEPSGTVEAAAPKQPAGKSQIPAASLAPEHPFSPLNHAILDQVIQETKAHLAGEFNLAEFMNLLKRGFQDGMKLNRAFFAMLDKDRKSLACRFMFGNEAGLRNLRIPVKDHNLFQRLLEKPQALRCQESNQQKVIPLIPKEFYKFIDTDEFFVMTIRAKGKPLGVVYADRYGNDYGLDEADYEKLYKLCQLLEKGFEHLGK